MVLVLAHHTRSCAGECAFLRVRACAVCATCSTVRDLASPVPQCMRVGVRVSSAVAPVTVAASSRCVCVRMGVGVSACVCVWLGVQLTGNVLASYRDVTWLGWKASSFCLI